MIDLRLGDCLEIMPEIPDGSVDAIITDLPYGTTKCKWDVVIPIEPMWAQVKRILKPRGVFVTTACQPFTSILVTSNIKNFRYEWTWNKVTARGHLVAKKRPLAQHENILVFYWKAPTYNPIMVKRPVDKIEKRKKMEWARTEIMGGTSNVSGGKVYDEWYPKTIITVDGHSIKAIHPTQKPVPLFDYLIRTYTNKGETVLDFCMGSGTTGVACVDTGRSFIGIEKDEGYFRIAKQRILPYET